VIARLKFHTSPSVATRDSSSYLDFNEIESPRRPSKRSNEPRKSNYVFARRRVVLPHRFLSIFTDCQRVGIDIDAHVHIDRPMVRHLLPIALQASARTRDFLDPNYLVGSAALRSAGVFRSAHAAEGFTLRHRAVHSMHDDVERRR
jgi:hypothetical protein